LTGGGTPRAPLPGRLLRRSRWRVAVAGALAATILLALLSAGAYILARRAIYGSLQERLESAAVRDADDQGPLIVDERGQIVPGSLPEGASGGEAFHIISDAELGALAVLRLPPNVPGPRVLATPAADALRALREFLWILVGLSLAGGLAALPIGYVLSGRALQPLEAAVRERSEFVARASHQLRTPLAIIRTSADLALAGQAVPPEEALVTIRAQTERMESLASRLTELGRASGAPPSAIRAAMDLGEVVRDAVAAIRPAAEQRGVGLELVAPSAGPRVRAQSDEIRDLLAAVLENAVKFSASGTAVQVRVAAERRGAVVEIADRGPGIPPEELASVTLPFYQGSRNHGGHGLGLAIARAIAERQGGRLSMESRLGQGTTVRVTLPGARG
jgi:signal transduction histidine kinase